MAFSPARSCSQPRSSAACELPNWIQAPRQVNACLERWMTVSALFFPSGMQTAAATNQPALAPGRRGVFR